MFERDDYDNEPTWRQEFGKVWAEIMAGDHDNEIFESVRVDLWTLTRVARQCVFGTETDVDAQRNLQLQIKDYAADVTDRRLA